jgi:hypothetical protein
MRLARRGDSFVISGPKPRPGFARNDGPLLTGRFQQYACSQGPTGGEGGDQMRHDVPHTLEIANTKHFCFTEIAQYVKTLVRVSMLV